MASYATVKVTSAPLTQVTKKKTQYNEEEKYNEEEL